MRRSGHPLPPPTIQQRRFNFVRNPYRQLTCVSLVRLVLGLISIVFSILEWILRSRYHETWHLAASGCVYTLASLLALFGCAYATLTKYRLLWFHSWVSITACLIIYPAEVGLMSLELCHDTAWCLCALKPRLACPPNWRVVPVELAALFVTTIAFVLNLLAAVVSRKTWKAASARLERMRSSTSCQRTLKRAKSEADECLATNYQQNLIRKHSEDDQQALSIDHDVRYKFVGAAAATAASAAAVPMMFVSSKTLIDHMNRPKTILYPNNNHDEDTSNACALNWWRSPENFV